VAHWIHEKKWREMEILWGKLWRPIPSELIESELLDMSRGFLHRQDRAGKFEAANSGTIFLDEMER